MAYSEDVNVNLNVLAGTMGGITAIMGGMSALTSSFGAMATEASDAFGTLDGLIVSATGMLALFSTQAASAFGEFEQGLKIVQAVSGQTSAAINQLTDKANEMSVTYRTSIGDITDGLQTLGRAGLNSVNEQLEVLESGLQTAKLEGRNLNGVLEELIQNTAMLGGDLKSINFGEQTEYLNSLMVGTSMTAPITSHDISQTLQYAGGTAAAAGANLENKDKLEDLMGTIAAFAQKGVSGSMAGTALRAFFTKPASQDKSVTSGLAAIGLSPEDLWENGGEEMRSVSDQIGIIQRQMDRLNLSTMDQVEIWGKIVGAKMGQQMMKLDSSTIKDITRDIQDAKSAEELATQTLQTYTQKINEMHQQSEMAFREFGAKVVVFLTPIVELITKIMGLLSHPIGSTVAFGTALAVVGHGLSRIWNMITTIGRQVKALLTETTAAIQHISGISGGIGTGFSQSSAQVDFLNAKLFETDSTLQAIQAKALGIKPGYIMPGALPTDRVPRGTLRVYEENVVIDHAGVMKGRQGQIYPGQDVKQYTRRLEDLQASQKEARKERELQLEERISAAKQKRADAEAIADEQHIKRVEASKAIIDQKMLALKNGPMMHYWKQSGIDPIAQEKLQASLKKYGITASSPLAQPFILGAQNESRERNLTPDQWLKDEKERLYNEARELSATERKSWLSGVYGKYTEQINALETEKSHLSETHPVLSSRDIKDLESKGITKVQTRMSMMTNTAFEKWYNALDENDPMQAYSKARTDEMRSKNKSLFDKYTKQGYTPAFISKAIPESHPNNEILRQAENQGYLQQYVNADQERQVKQIAKLNGEYTVFNRAQQLTTNRLNTFGNVVNGVGSKIKNLPSTIGTTWSKMTRNSSEFLQANAPKIQTQAMSLLKSGQLDLQGQSTAAALTQLRNALGLTTSEFSVLISDTEVLSQATKFTEQEIRALGFSGELLREEIARQIIGEGEETAVTQGLIAEKSAEIGASAKVVAAKNLEAGSGVIGSLKGGFSSLGKGISSVVGMMGGPFMAGMMAVTVAMQAYQHALAAWQEKVQKATDQMSEASDKLSNAMEKITELYKEENGEVSDITAAKIIDEQYSSIYEASQKNPNFFRNSVGNEEIQLEPDLSYNLEENRMLTEEEIAERQEAVESITLAKDENVKALNENTMALVSATNEYQQALGKQAKEFNDGLFGFNGLFTNLSDDAMTRGWGEMSFRDEGFLDNNSPILNNWQTDKNYMGSTDFAPIFAMDSYKYGTEQALNVFFGNDVDRIIGLMSSMDKKVGVYGQMGGRSALQSHMLSMANMDADTMATAQMLMKNNPEDFQILGKQMFRYEQQSGFKRSAMSDYDSLAKGIKPITKEIQTPLPETGFKKANKQVVKQIQDGVSKAKITVTDKNLMRTVNKLMELSDNKLTEANVLALGQLQQLQDMYTIANESIAPGINQTVQGVMDNITATGVAGTNAGEAAGGAVGASANAAAIASFLGAQAQETAEHSAFMKYERAGGEKTEEQFRAALGKGELPQYERMVYESLAGTGWSLNHPGASQDMINKNAYRLAGPNSALWESDATYQQKLDTATNMIMNYAQGAVLAGYSQSNIGEYGRGNQGSGGGSGGGGSGGSGGDKDKGSGTKKERVDLVLCNKKEIPKLNVNLFKKPPNFTVLNKNFKVRDIKINSQDKPKSIMNAIKNGIIETQKRMDPKIIQDEDAVYDPVAASDGTTSTPSGTTKTTTNKTND